MKCYPRIWTRCQIITGSLMIAVGIFLLVFIPWEIKQIIYSTFSIAGPHSAGTEDFVQQPVDAAAVYNSYYIWNVTNPREIENEGADPILVEVGPYTYRQRIVRASKDFIWRANGTLEYIEHCQYIFQPDRSVGSESDVYTTVNMGYVGAMHQTQGDWLARGMALLAIQNTKSSLFMRLSVNELLWGYTNPILKELSALQPSINPWVGLQTKDDFNDASVRPAAVITGGKVADGFRQPDPNELRQMTMWNGMHGSTNLWGSKWANMINGTDGTCFHPYFEESEEPAAFVDSLFRAVFMSGCGTVTKDGVKLYCLSLREDMLASAAVCPDNEGFFMKTTGFIPIPPVLGQPVHISLPHFHRANWSDPLANKVKFIPDDHEDIKYDTRLYVEPFTGQLMDAHKRLQINTILDPQNNATAPSTATHTYLPIVWIDQYPVIADSTISAFKTMVYLPYYASIVTGSVFVAAGALMIILAILRCTCWVSAEAKAAKDYLYGIDYTAIPRDSKTDSQSMSTQQPSLLN